MYPPELTAPMAKQLTDNGFEGLTSSDEVKDTLNAKEGTVLMVVNSVCGCAAGNARPGVLLASKHDKRPDRLTTVFAGVDKDAVDTAREFLLPYPPSSPSIALFKEGKLVHFLERQHIEGSSADMIAANLKMAFDHYC